MSQEPSKRDRLVKRRDQLSAQIQALDARARAKARKDDTRRKIIIGALVLARAQEDARLVAAVDALIAKEASSKDREFLKGWRDCLPEVAKKSAKPSATKPKPKAEQKTKPQSKSKASRPVFPRSGMGHYMRDWSRSGTFDPSDPYDLDLLRRQDSKNRGRK